MRQPQSIELQLRKPEQLFNTFDPSPFSERDLDRDAESHIVGWAREVDRKAPLQLVVRLPPSARHSRAAAAIPEAVAHYFAYASGQARLERRELMRIGGWSLCIGVAVLAASFLASQQVTNALGNEGLGRLLAESLLILGWVANWKPLEIFLYDWWPLERRRKLYRRLASMQVDVQFTSEDAP